MTNVNVTPVRVGLGGNDEGLKCGVIDSAAKAAEDDTWTVIGASSIIRADITVDATGAAEPHTISGNEITLTSATTGACSGTIYYK
jgi:hypothetical protein